MTFPAILTAPGSGFDIAAGLYGGHVGDDGDVFILGHHDDAQVKAALQVFDDRFTGGLRDDTWAVLADPPECDCGDPSTCGLRDESGGAPWWLQWDVDEGAPGAFPVTVVYA